MRIEPLLDLERQITALLKAHDRLKDENRYLREKQALLIQQRDRLRQKNHHAGNRVGHLIEKLEKAQSLIGGDIPRGSS